MIVHHKFCTETNFCLICGAHISHRFRVDCVTQTDNVTPMSHLRAKTILSEDPNFNHLRRMRLARMQREDIESDLHELRCKTEGHKDKMSVIDMLSFIRRQNEIVSSDDGPRAA